jgi:hypothetical protein
VNKLTVHEAALAWAQGKRVEAKHNTIKDWVIVKSVGGESFNTYSPGIFGDDSHSYKFRLAPEPPAKEWRPWTAEEVPVGAQVRYKGNSKSIRMLIVCDREPHLLSQSSHWKLQDLLVSMEHSIDHGKTWLPCGVEVTAIIHK